MSLAKPAAQSLLPLTLGFCWLTALAEGFDIQSMGVAAPGLAAALALRSEQLGPVFSASLVGLLLGALACGRLSDRVGRKWVLIASLIIFGVFSFATSLAWNVESLLIVRLLAGLGLGGAMPNLLSLTAEAVGEARRARTVTFVTMGYPIGGALAAIVAAGLTWREIFWIGGLGPLALAAAMAPGLPESRGFLVARPTMGGATRANYAHVLFAKSRSSTTLLLWTASFSAILSLYMLLNWLPLLMVGKGVGKAEASLVSVLFNLGGAAGTLTLAAQLDHRRRGWIVAGWYVALAGSVVALALASGTLASAGMAGFAAGVFVVSASVSLYGLATCFYPLTMRGSGVGASTAVGRLGAIAGPLLAGALLSAGARPSQVLLALLPAVAAACVATLVLFSRPTVSD